MYLLLSLEYIFSKTKDKAGQRNGKKNSPTCKEAEVHNTLLRNILGTDANLVMELSLYEGGLKTV